MTCDSICWDSFLKAGCLFAAPELKKVWIGYGIFEYSSEPINQSFYRNNFFLSIEKPWIKTSVFFELNIEDFFVQLNKLLDVQPNIVWSNINFIDYEKDFNFFKNEILNSSLIKAVPFVSESGNVNITKEHLVYFLKAMGTKIQENGVYFYGFWNFNQPFVHLGITPELLFINNQNIVSTIALAGTSKHPKIDFQKNKYVHEHEIVVVDISNQLKKFGRVSTSCAKNLKFTSYSHKLTKIKLHIEEKKVTFEDLVDSIHPSAAIGLYPRINIHEFYKKHIFASMEERDFFAAPFGLYLDPSLSLCVETIRGVLVKENIIKITAGGGIVAESCVEEEWDEVLTKIKSIRKNFQIEHENTLAN